jgi:acyl carrier protein
VNNQVEMANRQLIREQVQEFVRTNFLNNSAVPVDDRASLSELGVLDETGALELVMFVEETYGFVVDEGDLVPENFDSVANVVAYIALRLDEQSDKQSEGEDEEGSSEIGD